MSLPDWLRLLLPDDTTAVWERIAPLVPEPAYLAGDTAVAVHIRHRVSRDLDFFFHENAVDLDELAASLQAAGSFAVTQKARGALNGVFSETKVQFLHADDGLPQRLLEPPSEVAGLRIAGLPDLMAMKLKVVGQRGELRDYFDLQKIEELTGHTIEEGLGYYVARSRPRDPENQVMAIISALGYLDDVDEDELLPAGKHELEGHWRRRQPELLKAAGRLTRGGFPPPAPSTPPLTCSRRGRVG